MKKIPHLNKRIGIRSQLEVKELGENYYEILYNDPFDKRYTTGTKIRTIVNDDGEHEVVEFIQSKLITKKYLTSINQNLSDLNVLIEELHKHGGRFQIDMGGIISVSIPKTFPFDLDKIIKDYNIKVTEMEG